MSVIVDGTTRLTYEEFKHFPDDGQRHEIIHGEHYVSPSPNTDHQNASRHIQFALYEQLERPGYGQVFDAPMDLELAPTDVVQPDLIVVLDQRRDIVLRSRLRGVPDLVVEILSPSTADRDRSLKLALYESHGVPKYWLVDTDNRCVYQHRLVAGRYQAPVECRKAVTFSGATVDLEDVWRRL